MEDTQLKTGYACNPKLNVVDFNRLSGIGFIPVNDSTQNRR